ncbi:MAG: phosphonate degradation HD-domain oxygenase [Gemmataceae bacterium]
MNNSIVDRIFSLFRERGESAYIGEKVSQQEHALQAAWAAEKHGAKSELIAAALLHDIGHLLHRLSEDVADQGIDDRHEEVGQRFLEKHFPPEVTEPVRLHVAAKRYLCAIDPNYFGQLSAASVKSLGLQGGPFSEREAAEFESRPHWQAAVALRRWDELAKVENLKTPDLEQFRPHLEACLVNPNE